MTKIRPASAGALTIVLLLLTNFLIAQNTSPYWSLAGNNNATATSKLGTTNAINLSLYTNNLERVRILSSNGYVGLGTIAPAARLDVFSTDKMTAKFNSNNSSMFLGLYKQNSLKGYVGSTVNFNNDVDFGTTQNNTLGKVHLTTKTISRMTVDTNGNVGINIQVPLVKFVVKQTEQNRAIQVQHQSRADFWNVGIGTNTLFYRFEYNGTFRSNISNVDGAYLVTSDMRLKEDIKPLDNALEKLVNLHPSTYYYKDSRSYASKRSIGFMAQEVEKEFPDLVIESDEGLKTINYTGLTVVAIKSLQEQQEKIATLTQKVEKLDALEKELADLKQLVLSLRNNGAAMSGYLEQNSPNPVNTSSVISYFVPASTKNARLILTDTEGKQLKQINLSNFGKGQITLNRSGLVAGTYTYSLYVDGKLTDSKRLVIAK